MKKVLGILFGVLLLFNCVVVKASDDNAFDAVYEQAVQIVQSNYGNYFTIEAVNTSNKITVTITQGTEQKSVVLDYLKDEGKVTYSRSSQDQTADRSYDTTILTVLVEATEKALNQGTTPGATIVDNLSSYNYTQYGLEGTKSGSDISALSLNIKHLNMSGTNTAATYGGSTGTGTGTGTGSNSSSSNTTETNPKTGVFVPVLGLSVLIVLSVAGLVWLGKNSAVKGL